MARQRFRERRRPEHARPSRGAGLRAVTHRRESAAAGDAITTSTQYGDTRGTAMTSAPTFSTRAGREASDWHGRCNVRRFDIGGPYPKEESWLSSVQRQTV